MTDERAETAMPGTATLAPILELEAPPLDANEPVAEEERDYGPDPGSEWVVRWDAPGPFDCEMLRGVLTPALYERFGRPTFYIVTPEGRTTYLSSANAPDTGIALIAGWSFWNDPEPDAIFDGAQELRDWLAEHPTGFEVASLDRAELDRLYGGTAAIKDVKPDHVEIVAVAPRDQHFDGKRVWDTMHAMGFRWGDMDCFQWADPHDRTDYLIWAEADDGRIGYVLPEEVAAGRQHFGAVRFILSPLRTPEPVMVFDQMVRAAECFAIRFGCPLGVLVDGEHVAGPPEGRVAVEKAVRDLAALGLAPCDATVMQLR